MLDLCDSRPNFFAMCSPNWDAIDCGAKDNPNFITHYECTGGNKDLISQLSKEYGKSEEQLISTFKRHPHTSFFSGHASLIWASASFVYLYLRRRVLSQNPDHLIAICTKCIQLMCIGTAIWVSYTRITDRWHHPTDVLGGAFVGAACQYFNVRYLMIL